MALSRIPDIRRVCTNPSEWPYTNIVFVPTEFEQWSGGGIGFDPKYTDHHDKNGQPVSVCSQFLSLLMGREDKPEWFDRPRIEFIDLRHGSDTLYFFRASRQMAAEAIENTQARSSAVFKLAGQSLPPELFAEMQRNLNLNDVGLMRQTAAAVADLPIDKQMCSNFIIEFNLNDESTAEDHMEFNRKLMADSKNLQRECKRINENIKRVSINLVDEGDPEHFVERVAGSSAMANILAHADELFLPELSVTTRDKEISIFGNMGFVLRDSPRLKFIVGLLYLRVRPSAPFRYRDQLYIQKLTCAQDITADDVLALTSHPVQSTVYLGQNQNQDTDDEDE
jgi:hypothetical protein